MHDAGRHPSDHILEAVERAIERDDREEVRSLLKGLPPADVAELIEDLDPDDTGRVFEVLDTEIAAEVLGELGPRDVFEVASTAPTSVIGALDEMEPDERADIIDALPEEQVDSAISTLPDEEAEELKKLLTYPPDSAGGIMTPEFVALRDDITASEAIALTQQSRETETIAHLFVCDQQERLVGSLPLHRLVFAAPDRKLKDVMDTRTVMVTPETDQEEVLRLATKYDMDVVAVVDREGRLAGVVTADDILEVAQEEANEDMYMRAGTSEKDPIHASAIRSTRLRLPWLLLTVAGGLGIAFMVSGFEKTLTAVHIAFFLPLIPLLGGNVAVQTSTIVVRGLAVGDIHRGRLAHFVGKQFVVTVLLAVSCGVAAGLMGALVPGTPVRLLVIVGIAAVLAIVVAGTLGTILPLMFNRLGIDPAISTGPFVTILNDLFCIAIYLSLGTAFS